MVAVEMIVDPAMIVMFQPLSAIVCAVLVASNALRVRCGRKLSSPSSRPVASAPSEPGMWRRNRTSRSPKMAKCRAPMLARSPVATTRVVYA